MFTTKSIIRFSILVFVILMISGAASAGPQLAQNGTGFTYQGKLIDGGVPANGTYDFQFRLFDALISGNQVGSTITRTGVTVTNGLFTVQLDFGNVFNGTALYLEIGVRPGGSSGVYSTLSPLQPLSPTPYALYSTQAGNATQLNNQPASYYQNASNINSGTLGVNYFNAYAALSAEGYLGNAASDLALNNGILQATLNSDLLDGFHAGNASGAIPLNNGTLNTTLNADQLDGQHGTYYQNASNINSGTLSTNYFSAYADLVAESKIGTGSGQVAAGDHNHWGQTWSGGGTGLTLSGGSIGLSGSGSNFGVYGSSTNNDGVYGSSTNGDGVSGYSDNSVGVYGEGNYGVSGYSTTTTGDGVIGSDPNGDGVHGSSTNGFGVYGTSNNGIGVYGFGGANGVSGSSNNGTGVNGSSTGGYGVNGSSANSNGVNGSSTNSNGIYGSSTNYTGVYGSGTIGVAGSGSTYGVTGTSTNNPGVYGSSTGSTGVSGFSTNGYGIAGSSTNGTGVYGSSTSSTNHAGVDGSGYYGVYGYSTYVGGAGVYGYAYGGSGTDYAGYFNGNVRINGNLSATGTKSAVVKTQDYGTRTLYAVESPENWFQDFGSGQLTNGTAVITIDPVYAETVNLADDYHVFFTPMGDCALYVTDKTPTSFTVKALGGQTCSIAFDYNIVAKRLGYETVRLAVADTSSPAVGTPNK